MAQKKGPALNKSYFINHPENHGLILDFEPDLESFPPEVTPEGICYGDWRIVPGSTYSYSKRAPLEQQRAAIAEPKVIAFTQCPSPEDLPMITAHGMCVKMSGHSHIALPDTFAFALKQIEIAAKDTLNLYGPDKFREAEFYYIAQNTDVEPGECHRPHFANWHTHVGYGQNLDMIYLFSNTLGTETRIDTHQGKKIKRIETPSPDGALMRIGAEIEHRPQVNDSEVTIGRIWSALTIKFPSRSPSRSRNSESPNTVMIGRDGRLFSQFTAAASEILKGSSTGPLESPTTLIEYSGIQPEYI
ncbi:MAG: hypothetical protein KDI13_06285 [Alphaproteobacteria bacterium]|nr:hypothetical protein [Alphaproteobacteria bacterium]